MTNLVLRDVSGVWATSAALTVKQSLEPEPETQQGDDSESKTKQQPDGYCHIFWRVEDPGPLASCF